jgi:diguanylate cyclase (GGDEF)-like protein
MSTSHLMLRRIASVLRYTQLAVLVLACGVGILIWIVGQRFSSADEWVEHSHEVIAQLAVVRSSTLRVGLGIRNFALAHDVHALADARGAADAAFDAATEAQMLTVDNPAQLARARRVAAEVRKSLAWLDEAAAVGRTDAAALDRLLVARVNDDARGALDRALQDMESHERQLLDERFAAQASHLAWIKRLGFGGGIAFALFMAWSIGYASRLMRVGHHQLTALNLDASRDPLTGLLNRRALNDAVGRLPAGQAFAVMAVDLDLFKPVNDRFGHAAGDQVLVEIARRLALQCREQDLIARVGGDEFALVLPTVEDAEAVAGLAARLRATVREPIVLDGGASVQVGASIGIAVRGAGMEAFEVLFGLADAQCYEAKRRARTPAAVRPLPVRSSAV